MDYTSYLNEIGICRKASPIREQLQLLRDASTNSTEKPIYLSGGLPNANTFPAVEASFTLRDGTTIQLDPPTMSKALQYDASPGNSELLDWIFELQRQVHSPPTQNDQHPGRMDCLITCGAQHGLSLIFENLVSKGDICLIESPAYAGVVALLKPLNPNLIAIETDEHGIIPSKLEEILSQWNPESLQRPGVDGPKLLYCIPACGNPTGHDYTLDRKKAIYGLARKYKFIIVEDDPYYYLNKKPFPPSFLSLDEDGRVLRTDSMSKIVSAGIRIGVLTGPAPLLVRMKNNIETSVQTASGLSQYFLLALFKKWGYEGFYENADKMADFYQNKKRECLMAANDYLKDVAEWNEPRAGMFLWIKMKLTDSFELTKRLIFEKKVFVVPGSNFTLTPNEPSPYIRVAYSNATLEEFNEGFQKVAEIAREMISETKKNTAG